jgi:diphthamide biosynthesis methyltransferase
MLYLIGLGLSDETDITVKGLDVVRKASRVYLEAYTSILLVDKSILVRPSISLSAKQAELTLINSRKPTMAAKS